MPSKRGRTLYRTIQGRKGEAAAVTPRPGRPVALMAAGRSRSPPSPAMSLSGRSVMPYRTTPASIEA